MLNSLLRIGTVKATLATRTMAGAILMGMWLMVGSFGAEAVREGTTNANMMIRRYERKSQFGRAALWHEAAATALDIISKPLARIALEACEQLGDERSLRQLEAELADMDRQREAHLRHAREDWAKASEAPDELQVERNRIRAFLTEWVPHYPAHFYEFGLYRQLFEPRIKELRRAKQFRQALLLEATAAEVLAKQYQEVTIRFFEQQKERARQEEKADQTQMYETRAAAFRRTRDIHLQRAARLRVLAEQPLDSWPVEAGQHENPVPTSGHRLTTEQAIQKAKGDPKVQQLLADVPETRVFAWFQGFEWTISFYVHGWENLAIVFLDDRTGLVTDVLHHPGDLEDDQERGTDSDGETSERTTLRLTEQKAVQIAMRYSQVETFLKKHPEAWLNPDYSTRYGCWIVEILLESREVGFVSISDITGEVLEVDIDDMAK